MRSKMFLLPALVALLAPVVAAAGDTIDLQRGDEPAPGECPVVQTVRDIDVPLAVVRGAFTVNGQVPIPWDSQSARIELRSDTLGVAELGALHEGGYDQLVVPGTYDVVYKHHGGTLVPANAETVLVEDIEIASGEYDFDVPSLLVMGDLTLGGGPFPASIYEQGVVRFRDVQTGAAFTVGSSTDGDYSAYVMPGTYDVVWSKTLGGDLVPANEDAVLIEGVTIEQSAEIDVDVPVVAMNGVFRINGAHPPNSVYENGLVSLRDRRTGDVIDLGQTRHGTWSKALVPGSYDVLYSVLLGGSIVPANERAVIATRVDIAPMKSLVIDIPTVRVVGEPTLDGSPFPASIYERGRIWLRGAEKGDLFELGETNDGGFDLRVVPGTYDVEYEGLLSNGLAPANEWAVIATDQVVQAAWGGLAPLDVDVQTGWFTVDATWWGEAFPASVYENADILAVGAGGTTPLFETRDGSGSARLIAGDYALHYSHRIGDDVPRNGDGRVGEGTASGFVIPASIDVESGLLSGVFTQGGAPFPALEDHYGAIALRDVQTGDRIELGETNEGQYDLELLSGTYDILYDHVEGNSAVANVGATVGCVTFAPIEPLPSRDDEPSRSTLTQFLR